MDDMTRFLLKEIYYTSKNLKIIFKQYIQDNNNLVYKINLNFIPQSLVHSSSHILMNQVTPNTRNSALDEYNLRLACLVSLIM